jgi:hypothetical protein
VPLCAAISRDLRRTRATPPWRFASSDLHQRASRLARAVMRASPRRDARLAQA